MFYKNFNVYYMFILSELWVPIISLSFNSLHLPVSEIANVLPEGVYYDFTKSTLFTLFALMFTTRIY